MSRRSVHGPVGCVIVCFHTFFPGRQEPLVLLSVGFDSTCNFSVFLPRASGGESGAAGVWALEKRSDMSDDAADYLQ